MDDNTPTLVLNLPDNVKQKVGFNVNDEDGQPFTSLPEGASFTTASDNTAASSFVKDETPATGPNGETYAVTGDVTTGKAGQTAVIDAKVSFADGKEVAAKVLVTVGNSAPSSIGLATIGDPTSDA